MKIKIILLHSHTYRQSKHILLSKYSVVGVDGVVVGGGGVGEVGGEVGGGLDAERRQRRPDRMRSGPARRPHRPSFSPWQTQCESNPDQMKANIYLAAEPWQNQRMQHF